ncbi:MAG: hypothetical protein OEX18_14965 [Candidatus Krumholzibacteria bacterium]|nr:hypothetical protein [Candidatus Krumholzibacteria bacterium]MDH4338569.1 hypothetical protein [Candidatus Krumholzibacteria bacterium]MDH5271320.1 hypothetical protein [Candidatus Krumholzibacteria bacterium]
MFKGLLVMLVFAAGCQAAHRDMGAAALSKAEALTIAVGIANDECDALYGERPFAGADFPLVFDAGRWHWGSLDPEGVHGYSVEVSFDSHGGDRMVVIYFSNDSSVRVIQVRDPAVGEHR